ncbi:MAG: hypothetical protein K8W52_21220 [Deltaproteobacteria bacterium]|nr:hypothetical protein [Deltaproteobacteria bacterium]
MRVLAGAVAVVAACGGTTGVSLDAPGPADAMPDAPLATIPADTVPCEAMAYWPDAIRSTAHPILVHYRAADEEAAAREVLADLDRAWDVEVGTLGFRPPVDDTGACGPDGALDVFLWRGHEECYVDVLGEDAATPYDDRQAFLVIDPWGPYGGAHLDTTTAHELDHVFQAADDWSDAPIVYEMTSVFIEDLVFPDDNQYVDQIADFQAHPDWSFDRDDGYETWYMYGAAQYLRFVRDRYFGGDAAFVGAMWRGMRSPADSGEPDFEDALDALLVARGSSFRDSMIAFARWRLYTGAHADAAHDAEGASFAEPARAAAVRTTGAEVAIAPMALGSAYIDVTAQSGDPTAVDVSLAHAASGVQWIVQVVPGHAGDGDTLDLSHGPVHVAIAGTQTIAVTALPTGAIDPEDRDDTTYAASVVIAP